MIVNKNSTSDLDLIERDIRTTEQAVYRSRFPNDGSNKGEIHTVVVATYLLRNEMNMMSMMLW